MSAAKFDWEDFNTFIKDASIPDVNKKEILCIFAKYLYNATDKTWFYYRFIENVVADIDASAGNTAVSNLFAFVNNEINTDVILISKIAKKLLVLASTNNYFKSTADVTAALAAMDAVLDSATVTYGDEAAKIEEIENIPVSKAHMTAFLYDWNGFDTIIYGCKKDDAKLYTAKYFACLSKLHTNNDEYINILKQLEYNDFKSKVKVIEGFKNKVKTADLIEIQKKLLFLFEKVSLETNISVPGCLNVFKTDMPTASYKVSTFDKEDFPADWNNYRLVSILSYDIAGLSAPTNINNVSVFLTNITAATIPYDNFRPAIITLQNTTELVRNTATYTPLQTAITGAKYDIFENDDKNLITLVTESYNIKKSATISGYLDTGHKKYFLACISDEYGIIIINVVNTDSTNQISFTELKNNAIEFIAKTRKDISNYDILITINGKFNYGDGTQEYVDDYEKTICTYNKADITDSYIISTGVKEAFCYNFHITGTDFKKDYSKSVPIGKRIFIDAFASTKSTSKSTTASTHTSPVAFKLTSLLNDIATKLDTLNQKEINQILASVSAPNATIIPPKKATSIKAPPVAATPHKKSAIYIPNITEIDFNAVPGFKLANFTRLIPLADYITFNSGGKTFTIKIKTNIGDFYINEKNILQVKTMSEEFCLKVTDTETPPNDYYITRINITDEFKIDIGGTEHNVPFNTSSKKAPVTPPGTNIDIAKLKYISFIGIPGFDHTKLAGKLPTGYELISGIKAKFTITLASGVTANVTESDIYWATSYKTKFCFNVKVSGADKFITGITITNKIIINMGKKDEVVKIGVNK